MKDRFSDCKTEFTCNLYVELFYFSSGNEITNDNLIIVQSSLILAKQQEDLA